MNTTIRRLVAILSLLCFLVIGVFALAEEEVPAYEPLEKGAKGEAVEKIQERLNALGYNVGRVDGDFGKKTKSAVEDFQRANALDITGIADEETQALLFSDDATPAPSATPTPKPTPKPTKKPSSSSSSSSSESLLSKQDCIELAEFYLRMQKGSITVQLTDATMDGNQCLVAIQYSTGYSTNVAGVLIDRRDGSLLYIQ